MLADLHVVCNLHQIVDLRATTDPGLAESRTIDADVGAELDIVLENDDPDLRHLVVDAVNGRETKAVGADHSPRVDDAPIPDTAIILDHHPRVRACSPSPISTPRPRTQPAPTTAAVTDGRTGGNRSQRADTRSFAN